IPRDAVYAGKRRETGTPPRAGYAGTCQGERQWRKERRQRGQARNERGGRKRADVHARARGTETQGRSALRQSSPAGEAGRRPASKHAGRASSRTPRSPGRANGATQRSTAEFALRRPIARTNAGTASGSGAEWRPATTGPAKSTTAEPAAGQPASAIRTAAR